MSDNVEALCRDWLDAKREENAANAKRLKIEEQLVQALEIPEEGSKTHKMDGFKVTVTQPITRKLDVDEWAKVESHCPVVMRPVKIKFEADATGCKWLQKNEPQIWKKIAKAFETKPGKVGFKVEEI